MNKVESHNEVPIYRWNNDEYVLHPLYPSRESSKLHLKKAIDHPLLHDNH